MRYHYFILLSLLTVGCSSPLAPTAELQDLQRRNFYRLECLLSRSSSHYVHEHTVSGSVTRTDRLREHTDNG